MILASVPVELENHGGGRKLNADTGVCPPLDLWRFCSEVAGDPGSCLKKGLARMFPSSGAGFWFSARFRWPLGPEWIVVCTLVQCRKVRFRA